MKKGLFILLATIAMAMYVGQASAWVQDGNLKKVRDHVYNCDPGPSYCSKSVNPNDPSASVGDRVKYKTPDRGELVGTIVSIDEGESHHTTTVTNDAAPGEVNSISTQVQ